MSTQTPQQEARTPSARPAGASARIDSHLNLHLTFAE